MQKKWEMDAAPRYEEVRCNRCGKSLALYQGLPVEDFVSVEKVWGYGSGQDGVRIQFDLCENCVQEIVAGFVLPPETEDVSELI